MAYARTASHAGSWYSDDPAELGGQLDGWLEQAREAVPAQDARRGRARAVVAPHAGYSYSGPAAAYAYQALAAERDRVRRVFVVGPSHHKYSRKCELPRAGRCLTPLGALEVDQRVVAELRKTGEFGEMTREEDEDEHSLEMHLPYVARALGDRLGRVTVVPLVVGSLSARAEARYGALLAPYLDDPDNFFVVSSDFCHWGARFRFQHHEPKRGEIWQSIEALDRAGMDLIEAQDAAAFREYQERTGNTICGRHPIAVLLHAVGSRPGFSTRFLHYSQSSRCTSMRDSSVSYASAVVRLA